MLPGGAMDGVGEGLGGNQAAPSLGDMGADSNDPTTDTCPCTNMEGECVPCPNNTLGTEPEPNPPPPPGPGGMKFMAAPSGDTDWDVAEDPGDDVDEEQYEETIYENAF